MEDHKNDGRRRLGELAVVGDEERTRKRERSEVLEAGKAKMRRESL